MQAPVRGRLRKLFLEFPPPHRACVPSRSRSAVCVLASTGKTAEDGGSKGRGSEKRKSLIWRSACSSGSQKSKKSEGRQELHSNLLILMECVLDLALGAPLFGAHREGILWTSHCPGPPGARRRAIVHSCARALSYINLNGKHSKGSLGSRFGAANS